MNFWKLLKIVSIAALAIILGLLYMASGDQPQQRNSSSTTSSSSDGAAFNGIK